MLHVIKTRQCPYFFSMCIWMKNYRATLVCWVEWPLLHFMCSTSTLKECCSINHELHIWLWVFALMDTIRWIGIYETMKKVVMCLTLRNNQKFAKFKKSTINSYHYDLARLWLLFLWLIFHMIIPLAFTNPWHTKWIQLAWKLYISKGQEPITQPSLEMCLSASTYEWKNCSIDQRAGQINFKAAGQNLHLSMCFW